MPRLSIAMGSGGPALGLSPTGPPPRPPKGVNPIRERLEAIYCWFYNRLSGSRCYAQGCGRRVIWHTPRQWNRCLDTPLAIEITDQGMARLAYEARLAELADLPDTDWQVEDVVPVTARGIA
jgi:hypothetical protein